MDELCRLRRSEGYEVSSDDKENAYEQALWLAPETFGAPRHGKIYPG